MNTTRRRRAAELVDADRLMLDGQPVDLRTVTARRWRDLVAELTEAMGRRQLGPAEKLLVRNAATIAVLCERDQAKLAAGEPVDERGFRQNALALRAALVALGLAAKSRDITKRDRAGQLDPHAAAVLGEEIDPDDE